MERIGNYALVLYLLSITIIFWRIININASDLIYYEEDGSSYIRIREKKIGNTVFTIVARKKDNAKQSAEDITKRLLDGSISDFVEELKSGNVKTDSLKGCNSGGKKQ